MGYLIVNVKDGQSRPKRACGVDPDIHDWATFMTIGEIHSCCTEMTEESQHFKSTSGLFINIVQSDSFLC